MQMVVPFTEEDKKEGGEVLMRCCYSGGKGTEDHVFCFGCINLRPPLVDQRGDIEESELRVRPRYRFCLFLFASGSSL